MNAKEQAQYRWDHVAKPLHSLGKLEDLIVQIAGIQQTADVCIDKRCALLGFTPDELTGRGAGLSDAGLIRKRHAINQALRLHQPDANSPRDVLAKVGGFEIAGMVGAFLGGMKYGIPVIIDGVISAVAALAAARICPNAVECMLPSHMSREPAMVRILEELNLHPILHADMALGEGTGAVALIPMLDMALKVYRGPHTFDDLGMEAYTPQEENK